MATITIDGVELPSPYRGLNFIQETMVNSGRNANGVVVSTIYIGDHWQVIVRTEEEEDFFVDTQYTYNEGDLVSVSAPKEAIKLTLKGSIDKYEI